jgi:hypothetical protein
MKIPLSKKILPILSGVEIGIPINLMSKISTEANFLKSPLTKESILLNFLLGFTTYKGDRYLDALETLNENDLTNLNVGNSSNSKLNYYESILENGKSVQFTLFCSYISLCIFVIYYHIGLIVPLITSTFMYKSLKQNKKISFLKPFYVAGMWTFSCCMIPLLLSGNEINQVSIIDAMDFNDYYQLLSPTFLSLFSTTNLADLKDVDEDLINGVNTLPILLGTKKTKGIVLISSLLSIYIFMQSEYFTWSLQNLFFISSGLFPNLNLFNFTNN